MHAYGIIDVQCFLSFTFVYFLIVASQQFYFILNNKTVSENIRIVMYELKSGNDALSLRKLKEKKIKTQMKKKIQIETAAIKQNKSKKCLTKIKTFYVHQEKC